MLKQVPNFVLGSKKSSTYPIEAKSCLGSSGRVGENTYASGFFSPAALLDNLFEHSVKSSTAELASN
jgi:hypothetical protein